MMTELFMQNPIGMFLLCGFVVLCIMEAFFPPADRVRRMEGRGGTLPKGTPISRETRIDELVAQGMRRGTAEKVVDRDHPKG